MGLPFLINRVVRLCGLFYEGSNVVIASFFIVRGTDANLSQFVSRHANGFSVEAYPTYLGALFGNEGSVLSSVPKVHS